MGIRELETRGAYRVTAIEKKKQLRIRDIVDLVFMAG